jgi:transglutaminase-like putative cysteine protease
MAAAGMGSGAGVELEVVHDTRYDYASNVSLAHHLAHLQPLQDAHQQLLAFSLLVEPGAARQQPSRDVYGNWQHHLSLAQPHPRLHVRATSRVRLQPRFEDLDAATAPAWDSLAAGLRYVACAAFEPAVEFALPSPYVPRLPALRDYALPSFAPGRPVAEAALALMRRLHADFAYQSRSTDIDTPLAQAFKQRRGVCQDFAHLLAGALRMLGLPARYVSGYLLTHPPAAPEGDDAEPYTPAPGPALLGADASHAWVQVWCPGTAGVPADGWLDLDPTNDMVPGAGHVRVAVGRDFGDVTPLRGVIRGGGRHGLQVGVSTRVLGAADDAAREAAATSAARA